ncbi:hypothetical protein DMENIID0001_097840 [Sergentomyia squamirostris]
MRLCENNSSSAGFASVASEENFCGCRDGDMGECVFVRENARRTGKVSATVGGSETEGGQCEQDVKIFSHFLTQDIHRDELFTSVVECIRSFYHPPSRRRHC